MRRFVNILVAVLLLGTLVVPIAGREDKPQRPLEPPVPANGRLYVGPLTTVSGRAPAVARRDANAVPAVTAPGDSFTLAEFTFDDSFGGPDPQGWIAVDISSPADTFFHVDNFAGLSGGYTPLEGSQSLWCGARPDTVRFREYATLPGYGNSWRPFFQSVPFASSGDVTVSFLIRYDS